MNGWDLFFQYMDAWLMPAYRLVDTPILGFYLGTALLALASVLLGEVTFNLAIRVDMARIKETTTETMRQNNLSIEALRAGNGDGYRACNKMANEAFGKMFFLQLALSAASLWPVPFALAWMQYRFVGVELPLALLPISFGYAGVFLPLYILTRVLFRRVGPRLPFFRGAKSMFADLTLEAGRMRSWRDLFPPRPAA